MDLKRNQKIRSLILKIAYEYRSEPMLMINQLVDEIKLIDNSISNKELHSEIKYLDGHYLIEKGKSHQGGEQYLNFPFIKITSSGVDLVENPEDRGKLFSVNITILHDIQDSAVNINSPDTSQNIDLKKD